MLFCNEPPFDAAQLACLLHRAVEANKKVEMQECRRCKPWVWYGENFEFIAELSPAPDDAKRKVAKTSGPRPRSRNGLDRENEWVSLWRSFTSQNLLSSNVDGES